MKKSKSMIVAFLVPAIIFFCAIFVYPIIRTLIMSFFYVENVTSAPAAWQFVGFDNFVKLCNTKLFATSMVNLFKIWFFGGIIVMVLSLLFAVILNSGIRFKKFFRAIIYMPNLISAVALAAMWKYYVYDGQFGLVKGALSTENIFAALLVAYCYGMVGYHMLIFSSGIEKIPQDYFEASTIDGAGKIRQFASITFPLLKGSIKTNLTMWSITSAGFFIWSQLFSTVNVDENLITPMVYMYNQTFGASNAVTERNAGLGAAIGVLLCICVVIAFTVINKCIKDDDLEF